MMPSTIRFSIRSWSLFFVGTMTLGCGGDGAKPAKKPVIQNHAPIVVNQPPAPAPASTNQSPASGGSVASNPVAKRTAPSIKSLPAGTSPKDVYFIDEEGLPMEVAEPVTLKPEEVFQVAAADTSVDSTRFVVQSLGGSAVKNLPKPGFSLPKGFVTLPDFGYSPDGLPNRILCAKSQSTMALVPAGIFRMGSNDAPAECQPEFPLFLDTFYIDIFEVTVGQFEKYRQELKEAKKNFPFMANASAPERTPALGVAWGTAQAYAKWLDMDLPTEAQFEKAARGSDSFRTPWGDGRAIWPAKRNQETITTVGAFSGDCSPFGVYDLAGNAREWCSDIFSDKAHREAVASSNQTPRNWPGPKKASNMNLRSVKGNGPDWSAWHRQGRDIGKGFPDVGFRCVLKL